MEMFRPRNMKKAQALDWMERTERYLMKMIRPDHDLVEKLRIREMKFRDPSDYFKEEEEKQERSVLAETFMKTNQRRERNLWNKYFNLKKKEELIYRRKKANQKVQLLKK
jgi:hypothetical protein